MSAVSCFHIFHIRARYVHLFRSDATLISSAVPSTSKFVTYFIRLQSHLFLSLLRHASFDPVRSVLILHMTPNQNNFTACEFHGVEENIWTKEGCSDGRVEKAA
jgi:hypothetical protein